MGWSHHSGAHATRVVTRSAVLAPYCNFPQPYSRSFFSSSFGLFPFLFFGCWRTPRTLFLVRAVKGPISLRFSQFATVAKSKPEPPRFVLQFSLLFVVCRFAQTNLTQNKTIRVAIALTQRLAWFLVVGVPSTRHTRTRESRRRRLRAHALSTVFGGCKQSRRTFRLSTRTPRHSTMAHACRFTARPVPSIWLCRLVLLCRVVLLYRLVLLDRVVLLSRVVLRRPHSAQ